MQSNLREMIASVSSSAQQIAAASEQLSATSANQASGAQAQKDQTQQVSVAMQEMSATVQDVSKNSSTAAEASRNAAETARRGGAVVEETLQKMHAISDSVGQTAKLVQELGDSSNQIGKTIELIESIANQTNLLAFNAAIEAARAGEQGLGFAVVADEVRKLAVSTTKATHEITQVIHTIQTGIERADKAMHVGIEQVESGVASTSQAGATLKEIIETSQRVGEMVMLIASAATEQAAASEEINLNVEQIARITEQTATGASESDRAIQELVRLAASLQVLVSKFNIGAATASAGNSPPGYQGANDAPAANHGGGKGIDRRSLRFTARARCPIASGTFRIAGPRGHAWAGRRSNQHAHARNGNCKTHRAQRSFRRVAAIGELQSR